MAPSALDLFQPAVRRWFTTSFAAPTRAQELAWPALARGESTLLLAPTGSGKTLAAFLHALDRLAFTPEPPPDQRCKVIYVSPLKALAVDVERNLRAPLAGIVRLAATLGTPARPLEVSIRTGDTPQRERAAFSRRPPDILITTPESLYLLLTSAAHQALRSVETVIVDEIHALVPTKRGSHLALSLERLEVLVGSGHDGGSPPRTLQRIGLSATQRPLDEVARFLGGTNRLVSVVDAGEPKRLALTVDVAVEDMARLGEPDLEQIPSGPASQGPVRPSIWSAIHPRLLELVRGHRSTLIFVNARRAAERLAAALNELAGETLVYAHHGSLARPQRVEIEDRLKAGQIRGLVATSSLELGIDMGAIDLVVQIEAPPSVASGLQRIGRAGHQVGEVSHGVIVPKYRGDLVTCAAITQAMHQGAVESTRYPRNPLDVLAQQIVAMVAVGISLPPLAAPPRRPGAKRPPPAKPTPWTADALFDRVRLAAPFAELPRQSFDGVLDMLSGRYPSDEFAELRPRLTWDRLRGTLQPRDGALRVAVTNAGTIPDRGLFAVFLATGDAGARGAQRGPTRPQHRVGELDEEMVFECRPGETFILGASTWRIEEITHDKVFVSPAPGEPGRMPFWKADGPSRPVELGQRIGRMVRELGELPETAALDRLARHHDLDQRAARNLLAYLSEQRAATGVVPDEQTVVIERCRDELGDWRICVMSPLGGQVLAPWTLAVAARLRDDADQVVESMWTDDGFVVRLVDSDAPFDPAVFLPPADDVEQLVMRQLAGSALFAAKFREIAGRALLLPKRRPGARAPLWQLRKRAADLLQVASNYGSFPMLLEAYRECLRDVFDLPALIATLRAIEDRRIRVVVHTSELPSPFARSLLFGFVANFLYDGDAPLAERRAAALAIDHAQLAELLGAVELRELLDPDVLAEVEAELQHLTPRLRARSADGLHDLLLRLGDLTASELAERTANAAVAATIDDLLAARRVLALPFASVSSEAGNTEDGPPSEMRYVAVEHASQLRDALGTMLPPGLPEAFLATGRDPLADLIGRYARTHGPFGLCELRARYGLANDVLLATLDRLIARGKLVLGAFRPLGYRPATASAWPLEQRDDREWCSPEVLAQLRRRSLARLRREIEPVEPAALVRFIQVWQGTARRRRGLDALLDVIEKLAGTPLPASLLETEILPARLDSYRPEDLDTLAAAGEVVWVGVEPLGERDGRVALFLTDQLPLLWRRPAASPTAQSTVAPQALTSPDSALPARSEQEPAEATPVEERIVELLERRGALFFPALRDELGGGFPGDLVDALWTLVWQGLVINDTFRALRAYVAPPDRRRGADRGRHAAGGATFRSRRAAPPAAEGRWSLVAHRAGQPASPTAVTMALAQQLLARYGVVARGVASSEPLPGGFGAVYQVLRRMEEAGKIRRGYFASGVGAIQFATPGALELLRSLRHSDPDQAPLSAAAPQLSAESIGPSSGLLLAATDPANPFGTILPWPTGAVAVATAAGQKLLRVVGARVVLVAGELVAYLPRGGRGLITHLPDDEADLTFAARALATTLAELARRGEESRDSSRSGLLIAEIDGRESRLHPLATYLEQAGFTATGHGYMVRRRRPFAAPATTQSWLHSPLVPTPGGGS